METTTQAKVCLGFTIFANVIGTYSKKNKKKQLAQNVSKLGVGV